MNTKVNEDLVRNKNFLLILKKELTAHWQLYSLVILPIVYIILFKYIPLYGAQIAFRNYNPLIGMSKSPWVGLDNFIKFFKSYQCWNLIKNTVLLTTYNLLISFPFPIMIAIGLNYVGNRFFKKTVQIMAYIPHFISLVVMVGILMQLMNTRTGVVNKAIELLSGRTIDFIGNPKYFRSMFVWSNVWQNAGWESIMYLAALSSIDLQLHEAAMVDGASKLRRIWHIDLPGILPTAIVLLILSMGNLLTTGFEKIILMQNPLNLAVSEVIDTYVYKIGLASQVANYSYPAAIGLLQSIISFALILLVNKISNAITEYGIW